MQTDTTVGFASQDTQKLYEVKSRTASKQFLKVYSSFKALNTANIRIPYSRRSLVRRSKKTTFIVQNKAFRVAPSYLSSQVLNNLQWNYSTSANESGKKFDYGFCEDKADIIIQDKYGLKENCSSALIKINKTKQMRIR